jgi:hypothetical protein
VEILDEVCGIFPSNRTCVVLASHSGGGSLVFGYLNAVDEIPAKVRRIAFLDSDYAYDSALHAEKLRRWLAASDENRLCVLAYQDYLGLLNGKPFVSENGGTWGRSWAMMEDLRRGGDSLSPRDVGESGDEPSPRTIQSVPRASALKRPLSPPGDGESSSDDLSRQASPQFRGSTRDVALRKLFTDFKITSETNSGLEVYSTTNRQIEFLLKENPEHKILHTVQVERNGFIQAMLSGTKLEGRGYEYLGEKVYTNEER